MDERWGWGLDLLVKELGPLDEITGDAADLTAELLHRLIQATGELPGGDIVDDLVKRGVDEDRALRILDLYYAVETGMGLRGGAHWGADVVERAPEGRRATAQDVNPRRAFRRRTFQRYGEGRGLTSPRT